MNVEELKYESIQPGPNGLMKVKKSDIVFTAHNEQDIETTIKQHYRTTPYPVGDAPSPDKNNHSFWSWGYFKRSMNHETYKENLTDAKESKIFMSEKYQQLGTAKYFEGALVDARTTFEIFKNNYDVKLFVKFTSMELTPL